MAKAIFTLVLFAAVQAAFGQSYSIQALDPLPGYVGSGALGVAENGDAAGYSVDAVGNRRATIWRGGEAIDVGGLAAFDWSEAVGITNSGTLGIAGKWLGTNRSVVFEPPVMRVLDEIFVTDVSESGYICGVGPIEPGVPFFTGPFLWHKGQFISVGRLAAGYRHESIGVGNTGEPVGLFSLQFTSTTCYWRLEPPNSHHPNYISWVRGGGTVFNDINGLKTMVGERIEGPTSRGIRFRHPDETTQLGTLPGFLRHTPLSINNANFVVGRASYSKEEPRAVIWPGNVGALRLSELLANDENWKLIEARRISDSGYIVGTGRQNGRLRAFKIFE